MNITIPSLNFKRSFNNRLQSHKTNSLKNNSLQKQTYNYPNREHFSSYISYRNISFCANTQNAMNSGVYKEFMSEYKRVFGDIPLEDTVKEALKSAKMIGCGREKQVYNFPKMPEYLISRLYHLEPQENLPIQEIYPIDLPKYNFGQSFATNNHDILIKKKIEGIQNGVDDYTNFLSTIFTLNGATKDMADNYLNKLRLFKDFPQESYDDLARKIEYLTNNGLRFVDSFNPNNLLIDTQNKRFNVIDVSLGDNLIINSWRRYPDCSQDKTSVYDIINLLLDTKFQYYFLKQLTPQERQEAISISRDVVKKCVSAAKSLDLSRSDDFFVRIITYEDKKHHGDNGNLQYKAYSEFKKMHQDALSEISDCKSGEDS